ncbi:hypothetical protein WJX72_006046 [[Myrmecia] bisecta]|uniref:Uncharacterized protein n=1 Tax=[Myrmecia] bisecta TaxID=41462 RepID=A0AAW1R7F6_9CHLO
MPLKKPGISDFAAPASDKQQVILLGTEPEPKGELSLDEVLRLHEEVRKQQETLEAAERQGQPQYVLSQMRARLRATAGLLLPQVTMDALQSSDWDERSAGCRLAAMLARDQPSACREMLPKLMRPLLSCVKDMRSTLSMDVLATVGNFGIAFGDELLPLMVDGGPDGTAGSTAGSMLGQLLLRATHRQDAADSALAGSWEAFVQQSLPAVTAAAILRVGATNGL